MKIRFGEISIGEQFEYSGMLMIKTHEYNARTVTERGKQAFLFQKKDLVSKKSMIPIWIPNLMSVKFQGNQIFPMRVLSSCITAFNNLGIQPMSEPAGTIFYKNVHSQQRADFLEGRGIFDKNQFKEKLIGIEPEESKFFLDSKYQGFSVKYRENFCDPTERFLDNSIRVILNGCSRVFGDSKKNA